MLDSSNAGRKVSPVRSMLRPIKSALIPEWLVRRRRNQKWERKWKDSGGFGWQVGDVASELAHAVDVGWLKPGTTVLDVGCGAGENAAWLAEHGFEVHGIDVSPSAIEEAATAHAATDGLTFSVVDVTEPGALDRRFEAIVDRGCLHGLPPELRAAYAANVKRWAKSEATLLLTMHTGARQGLEVRRAQVTRMLSPEFSLEDVVEDVHIGELGGKPINGVAFHLLRT
jgi:SAM-dependent methyltransferase